MGGFCSRPSYVSCSRCVVILIPFSVRWDPKRENPIHLFHSATLFSLYYLAQIATHRPFIHTNSATTSLTSLAICANAARCCCHIIDRQHRTVGSYYPYTMVCLTNLIKLSPWSFLVCSFYRRHCSMHEYMDGKTNWDCRKSPEGNGWSEEMYEDPQG